MRKLYAIYKNGEHKGNERGVSKDDAIKNYVVASSFEEFLNDNNFMQQYDGAIAVEGVHFNELVLSFDKTKLVAEMGRQSYI